MKKTVLIGVMPLYDYQKKSLWMLPAYMDMLSSFGAIPVMFPLTDDKAALLQLCSLCGGFLFTGGQDVNPAVYGEKVKPQCGEICDMRDSMERIVLDIAMKEDKSVLGICRGIQFINAALGGDLYQDLPTEHPTGVEHHMSPPYERAVHKVTIEERSPLYRIVGKREIGVNSYHHQAVKKVAPTLKVAATSEDGVCEGVYMENKKFFLAVQWHPEFSYLTDDNSKKIVKAFVDSLG